MAWWMMIPSVLQAGGTLLGMQASSRAAKIEQMQYRQQADATRAMASMNAAESLRQSQLAESRAIAIAAASGGGVSDVNVVNAIADLKAKGEFDAMSALYEGETQARSLDLRRKVTGWQSKISRTESLLSAGSQLGSGAISSGMFDKYK